MLASRAQGLWELVLAYRTYLIDTTNFFINFIEVEDYPPNLMGHAISVCAYRKFEYDTFMRQVIFGSGFSLSSSHGAYV